ncbi:Protein RETICULATA-RELATED 4, chloroplastic, partial [Linum perenne]
IQRNGTKLFAVGTASSLIGTSAINALINAKKAVGKSGEIENVPILSTSVGYGVYMAVSSNLRYQILAGVIEQRILEPVLHQHKLLLSALCFAVRTGNTYLGSLLWVDYARMTGLQKSHEEHKELA